MKVVIAPDSFKESMSAAEVADAIALGVRDSMPDAEIVCVPMADGGEGTVDAVLAAVAGERRSTKVSGPLGVEIVAEWGWLPESNTAVIEMASASGIHLTPAERRDVNRASTFGTGQLILAALDAGAERVIIGFGGSGTNDGGSGMLSALGARFTDETGSPLSAGGYELRRLQRLDIDELDPRLSDVSIEIACDVDNPLCGPKGASHVFGPQKGATPDQVLELDRALAHFADKSAELLSRDVRDVAGTGAAGGIGFAALAFLDASFRPGVQLIAELAHLSEAIEGADLVITGEGKLDEQTLYGKTPAGVAAVAAAHGVPTIAIAGTLGAGYQHLREINICAAFSIAPGPITLHEACSDAARLLRERASDIIQVWSIAAASAR